MDFVLRAKHWKIFIFLMLCDGLSNFTIGGEPILTLILNISGLLFHFSWILILGHSLHAFLPKKIEVNYNFFLLNFLLLMLSFATIFIVYNNEMHLEGFASLLGFYIFFAMIYVISFPGRIVKSIELGRKPDFGENVGCFFLMLFWPIGIWFIQPKVNRVAEDVA